MRASLPLRMVLAAGLAVALAIPAVATDKLPAGAASPPALAVGALDWLSAGWRWLWGFWPNEGPGGDPDGRAGTRPAPAPRPLAGPGGDPSGHSAAPAPAVRPLEGPGGDPSGHSATPAPAPHPTAGPGGDPNGGQGAAPAPAPRPASGRGGQSGGRL